MARSPELVSLQRRQLDAKLARAAHLRSITTPNGGWIKAIRTALGMNLGQLGRRLNMTPQGARDLERREVNETITVAKLRTVATALNCDLLIALVPKTSLEDAVQQRASIKAQEERSRIVHTMRLEAQQSGVEEALDPARSKAAWLTTRLSRLWD